VTADESTPILAMIHTAESAMVTALARRFGGVTMVSRDPLVLCIGNSREAHVHITLEGRAVMPDPPPGAEPMTLDPPGLLGIPEDPPSGPLPPGLL
jgi:hypothetical protein